MLLLSHTWSVRHDMPVQTCSDCGRFTKPSGHECASIDARGPRYCIDCNKLLSNTGYERWQNRCGQCTKTKWRAKERTERAAIKEQFGGACGRCGYNRCQAALHFHHINGREGEFKKRGSVNLRELKKHPERFELVCANCHTEIHQAF